MNPSSSKYITGNLIAASAGTGKTYQLTSRFVALLALGARPEKMIALTFTKKAAGEFRNRIFQALSDGALGKADYEIPQRNAMAARVWET
ncbi:MAG: UvrD-helicase domain-containing protein, partial [Akkermansia sp.]|nr:UvrD-helicase domain-containing protein [Akkermansia sp.]